MREAGIELQRQSLLGGKELLKGTMRQLPKEYFPQLAAACPSIVSSKQVLRPANGIPHEDRVVGVIATNGEKSTSSEELDSP